MIRQAVILAGGLGTRLGALTSATPKPLLRCGDRPFLAWLLRELCRFGIEEVVLLTGYLAEAIEADLPGIAAALPRPLAITCAREARPAGTGGALFHARDRLAHRFLLCNGDSWLDFNLGRLLADAARDPPGVVGRMVLRRLDDATRSGVADLRGETVTGFRERPEAGQPGMINAGLYLFDRAVLDELSPACSLERDVLPRLAADGRLRGTVGDGYFIDIGLPADLVRAQVELPARLLRRALFFDRAALLGRNPEATDRAADSTFGVGVLETFRAAADGGWHVFVIDPESDDGAFDLPELVKAVRAAGGTIDDTRSVFSGSDALDTAGMLSDLIRCWRLDPARCLFVGQKSAALRPTGIAGYGFPGGDLSAFVRPLLAAGARD